MKDKSQISNLKSQIFTKKSEKKKNSGIITICILILFLLPSIFGLLHSGFPSTDDGGWMIIRFSAFYEALRHGQFPVRFLMRLNNGYGYPVADFLYPLFMYVGVPIHIVGVNFINTIKIILGGSLLLSGIFTYLWLRKLFSALASFMGAVVSVFFPYHLYDVYQRGSVGEVIALAVVPFVFWQIARKSLIWVSVGIALLILSHNTLAVLFLPVIVGYMLVSSSFKFSTSPQSSSRALPAGRQGEEAQSAGEVEKLQEQKVYNGFIIIKKSSFGFAMTSVLLGLGLSAFFWLPALYDKQFIVFDSVHVSDFSQYFLQTKNFGLLGIFALMITIIGINFVFKKAKKHDIFFLGIIYIGLFFSLPISAFAWNLLPLPQLVQFPFRFLSIVILGIAFMTSYMLGNMKSSIKIFIFALSLFLVYAGAWPYLFPKTYNNYPNSYYATNQDSTTVKNEYMPKWVREIPTGSPEEKIQIIQGNGSVSHIISNGANNTSFDLSLQKASTIAINTIYFPGWKILVNNKLQQFSYNNSHGIMEFRLPQGTYTVIAKFGETPVRTLSDIFSLLSLLVVVILLVNSMKKFLISNFQFLIKFQ